MSTTFPGETAGYRVAREQLLAREIELRRATEAVAAARRDLPPGGIVPEDYVFEGLGPDGTPAGVRLTELFAQGKDTLVLYSFMYGPEMELPCPGCTHLLDQLDGTARHVDQRVSFAVVAKSPLPRILAFAGERGWRHVRLLSSARNTYNWDYHGETADGQMPMLNVFRRDRGVIGTILSFIQPLIIDAPGRVKVMLIVLHIIAALVATSALIALTRPMT